MPEVDGHGARCHEVREGGDARASARRAQRAPQEREQGRLSHPDQQKRRRGRVEVLDEVRRVDAEHETGRECDDRGEADEDPCPHPKGVDAAVCEEEADLLEGQPHRREVEEADGVDPRGGSRDVDRDGGGRERDDRRHGCPVVGREEGGQESLAEQEDPQEPQRLAEPEPRDRDEVIGHPRHRQEGEAEPHRRETDDGGEHEAVDATGHEVDGGATASTGAAVGRRTRETSDHEEQRHDLKHPRDRGEPRCVLRGVGEDRSRLIEGDPDHERVEHHDTDDAECTDEVDAAVARCPGRRDRRGVACCLRRCRHDGHGVLLESVSRRL